MYASRKDVLDFVGRISLKEYVYSDDVVDGTPDFRKKPIWCPSRNRDLILEAYANELEGLDLNAKCYRNLTKE